MLYVHVSSRNDQCEEEEDEGEEDGEESNTNRRIEH